MKTSRVRKIRVDLTERQVRGLMEMFNKEFPLMPHMNEVRSKLLDGSQKYWTVKRARCRKSNL